MAGNLNSLQDDEMISGINVTPLVDVVLVLLIIFLITAPVIYQSSIKIHLAKAATGEQREQRDESTSLNLAITKSGEILWNNERVDWSALDQRLKGLGEKAAQKTAVISADRDTAHGTVVQLMDTLRKAGVSRMAINVEPVSK